MYFGIPAKTFLIKPCDYRLRVAGRTNADVVRRSRHRDRATKAIPAPEANAELQTNIDVCLLNFMYCNYHYQNFIHELVFKPLHFATSVLKQRRRLITHANAKSKSEKFPPPHQDGTLGYPLGSSHHMDTSLDPPEVPFTSMNFLYSKDPIQTWSGPLREPAAVSFPRRRSKPSKKDSHKDKNSVKF